MSAPPDIQFYPADTALRYEGTFSEAKSYLLQESTEEYLSLIIGSIEVDYKPIEKILGLLTSLIHARFEPQTGPKVENVISVIPRGSFATRTAIKGVADLDIDVIFPDSFPMTINSQTTTIKQVLGTDETGENILFERDGLKTVLQSFWTTLSGPRGTTLPPVSWLKTMKDWKDVTRSLSLQTNKIMWDSKELPEIPIDIFVKVRTKVRGQDLIIGIDKDSPMGSRRYQTTTFIPSEGKWLGDRVLSPVDRFALLTLKWWKADFKTNKDLKFTVNKSNVPPQPPSVSLTFPASKVEIKSHHLLAALNALHDLDINDDLYIPTHRSRPFSLRLVKEVMWKVLTYLNRAYSPASKSLIWTADGSDLDYFFPQFSYETMETLFMEARADWTKFCYLMESKAIPTFADEIFKSFKPLTSGQ